MNKLLVLLFLLSGFYLAAQKKNDQFRYHIRKTHQSVKVDGLADDPSWATAASTTPFHAVLPMDTGLARVPTEVRMTFDDRHLYLLAICYHAVPGPYYVESLRRDFAFGKNDNFLLFMDPFDDQTNGFSFGANAAGAQWDGTMYAGGNVDLNWDNKWVSAVRNEGEKWVLEMAIPFTSIRYKKGIKQWGVNFSRLDLKTTEKSSWAPVPRQFPTASLAYSGVLVWEEPPPPAGTNVAVIPYALGGTSKEYGNGKAGNFQKKAGADIKIGVTSALNLDLTIHPDFSQVEVDRQQTNLDRFELFFPERRQFFLENGDLFANFGYASIRPFFSRRIGLGVPIRAGARLSGKLNKDWRIGAMDMQTARVPERGLPDQNFGILSLQRRVFSRSNIGILMVNKQSVHYTPDTTKPRHNAYNRNLGLEYNLASSNNLWTGKALLLKAFSPEKKGHDWTQAAHLEYRSRKWNLYLGQEYVGRNYTAEVGYVPRTGYHKVNPLAARLFFPKGGNVLSHGPAWSTTIFTDENIHRTDHLHQLAYNINFRKQSTLMVSAGNEFVRLLFPFDPTNIGKDTLPTGSAHHWNVARASFTSKPQSLFTYAASARYGGYYAGGTLLNLSGEAGYRFQPFVSLLFSLNYNNLQLPQPWNNTAFWLLGSKMDLTMTNKLFFSTFLQYNEQLKNINLNARFQWRYQPASDLFIVYTDNYLPQPFSVRNRAVVLKLTYWWNS